VAPWSTVALWVGCVTLATADVPQLNRHYQAATLAITSGNTEQAKRELKLSLQENPLDSKSHFLLASLLGQEGDIDQAIVGFQQTVQLEPTNTVARYNLGTTLLWRSEPIAAAKQLEDALSIDPDHVPSYVNLGKAYMLAGIPELAVASYREALRRAPSNPVAIKNLALLTGTADAQQAPGPGEPKPPVAPTPAVAARVGRPEPATAAAEESRASTTKQEARDETTVEVEALRELIRDLPHVTVEARGGWLTLTGWTSGPFERKLLDRVLAVRKDVIDMTSDDVGDHQRLIEVDAVIFKILGFNSQKVGHNFLRSVEINAAISDGATAAFDWLFSAAISYEVNIANVSEQRVAFLARPHLTTISGTPATFLAGGDIVFVVAGNISGDIKPYPFGTTLEVTPTLLRTQGEGGLPRVRLSVKAGRKIFLALTDLYGGAEGSSAVFENVEVTSEAVVNLNQTLILTGLNQREHRTIKSGVPGLRSIPVIKYLFSESVTTTSDLAIVILLTPRDPAFWDERTRKAKEEFVEKRRAFVQALRGTDEDMRRFKERYPDWDKLAPNRFASHFFLMENSEAYRRVNGIDLADESLSVDLLSKKAEKKK
jgi:Flp pilus assembly protein TadD